MDNLGEEGVPAVKNVGKSGEEPSKGYEPGASKSEMSWEDCLTIVLVVVLLYLLWKKLCNKEGMENKLLKGSYTSSLVDRDSERRYYTQIDDNNANPIKVDCAPDGTKCRDIDASRLFVKWSSQI